MSTKVIPPKVGAPQMWNREIDGRKHQIIGRLAYTDGLGLATLMLGASWWIDGKMVAMFRNSQFAFFVDKWELE